MTEHWIDRLSHALAGHTSRRQSLRLAALLAGSLVLGGEGDAAGKSKRKRKSAKGKGKGKPGKGKPGNGKKPASPPDHMGDPSGDDCDAFLGGDDPEFLQDCRQRQQQCQAPDQFCIFNVDTDPAGDERGFSCCASGTTCCIDGGCADTLRDPANCGSCGHACGEGEVCAAGQCVCVTLGACCPSGSTPCSSDGTGCCADQPGYACCGDGCKFIAGSDRTNCGGCGVTCPRGQNCIDGECRCNTGYKYCPVAERCVEERMICCGGGPVGYCSPDMVCCGSGDSARCIYQWQTC